MNAVSMTVTVNAQVDPLWVQMCTEYSDLFLTNHCGYWACGVEREPGLGWLAFEHGDECRPPEKTPQTVLAAWRNGKPLPKRWYRLDEQAALRAWAEGVKRSGTSWFENGDASDYDVAIQNALLGEVRYG